MISDVSGAEGLADLALNLRVSDAEMDLMMNLDERIVGSYFFDLLEVYSQKDHEYREQWVGLTRKVGDTTTFGYLRVTVEVLGPGDKSKNIPVVTALGETSKAVQQQEPAGGASRLVLKRDGQRHSCRVSVACALNRTVVAVAAAAAGLLTARAAETRCIRGLPRNYFVVDM